MSELSEIARDSDSIVVLSLVLKIERLEKALVQAVEVAKAWHNADDVWQLYYDNAPEMKLIREALKEKP